MMVRQAIPNRQLSEKSGVVDGQPRASETQNPMRSYSDSPHTKPSFVTEPLRPLAFERAQKTSPCQPPQATTYMAGPPAPRLAPQIIGGRRMLHRTTSRKTPFGSIRAGSLLYSQCDPANLCLYRSHKTTSHTRKPGRAHFGARHVCAPAAPSSSGSLSRDRLKNRRTALARTF